MALGVDAALRLSGRAVVAANDPFDSDGVWTGHEPDVVADVCQAARDRDGCFHKPAFA